MRAAHACFLRRGKPLALLKQVLFQKEVTGQNGAIFFPGAVHVSSFVFKAILLEIPNCNGIVDCGLRKHCKIFLSKTLGPRMQIQHITCFRHKVRILSLQKQTKKMIKAVIL